MPSERFLRLPKEKREVIRQAAIDEFKRVPPEDVSINQIIKKAEISRGSFYTYFEDKNDLLGWLINDQIQSHRNFFLTAVKEEKGNIWRVFLRVFDHSIDQTLQGDFLEIIGNLINSSSFAEYFRRGLGEEGPPGHTPWDDQLKQLYEECDKSVCPVDYQSFCDLFELHQMTLARSLKEYFCRASSREQATGRYRRYMEILRYGICPREAEDSEHGEN